MKLFTTLSVVAIMLVACSKKDAEPAPSKVIIERHADAIYGQLDTMGFFYNTDNTLARMYLTSYGVIQYNYIFRYVDGRPSQILRGYYLTDIAGDLIGTFDYRDKWVNFNWSKVTKPQSDSLVFNDKQQILESHMVVPGNDPRIRYIDRFFWTGNNITKTERYDAWIRETFTTTYTYDDKKNVYPAGLAYVIRVPDYAYYLSANNITTEVKTSRNNNPQGHTTYKYLYNDKGLATTIMKTVYDSKEQILVKDTAIVIYTK